MYFFSYSRAILFSYFFCAIVISSQAQNETDNGKGDKSLPTSEEELSKLAAFEKGVFKYNVEDFFVRAGQSSFKISPEGSFISYMERDAKGKTHVYIRNVKTGIVTKTIEEKKELIRGYYWANEQKLIYYTDKGGDENYKLFVTDINSLQEICLTPYDGVSAEVLKLPSPKHPDDIIILMNKDNPEFSEPFSVNIVNGIVTKIYSDTNSVYRISNYYFGEDMKVNAYIRKTNDTTRTLFYKSSTGAPFKPALITSASDKFEIIDYAFNTTYPHDVYVISNHLGSTLEVYLYDLVKKKIIKKLFSNPSFDLTGIRISKSRNREIDYYTYIGERFEIVPVSSFYKEIHKKINLKIGKSSYQIYGSTATEDKYLLDVFSDKVYHRYYLYDVKKDKLLLLADLLPQLKEADMAENRPIKFKSRDGMVIYGYIIIPREASVNNKVPLLVNPHGGPFEVRNEWSFNREAQLFASRGYATLQVNFRGSGGYGKSFLKAGYKQIGRKMLEDLEDGVKYVLSLGLIDKNKVGIYGGSYGGLAALGSLVKTPELYACAVDIVGISNLFTFYASFPPNWKGLTSTIYEQWYNPSNPGENKIMQMISPSIQADKISKPLLVAHGANDPRVSIKESDAIVATLRSKGIDVPYLVKYNEGHGFSREVNRMQLYKVMIGFFAKHLKGV